MPVVGLCAAEGVGVRALAVTAVVLWRGRLVAVAVGAGMACVLAAGTALRAAVRPAVRSAVHRERGAGERVLRGAGGPGRGRLLGRPGAGRLVRRGPVVPSRTSASANGRPGRGSRAFAICCGRPVTGTMGTRT